jgi:hypothetical protein
MNCKGFPNLFVLFFQNFSFDVRVLAVFPKEAEQNKAEKHIEEHDFSHQPEVDRGGIINAVVSLRFEVCHVSPYKDNSVE